MKSKAIPKVVLIYLGLIGFDIGTILTTISFILILFGKTAIGLGIYLMTWGLALFGSYIIALRSKETLETWLPFLKETKKK